MRDAADGMEYDMIMENPLGSLRERPYMKDDRTDRLLKRTTVDYCSYGKPYRKSTDLWTSFQFEPRGVTGNGRCELGACGQGTRNKEGRFKHRITIGGENERRLKGRHLKKRLWSLPKLLCEELMMQMRLKGKEDDNRNVIIDLFSGGESWRETVEQNGYIYIPVDLRTINQ